MSYDFPDDYVKPPPKKLSIVHWFGDRYWRFVLWCALDSKSKRLNRWGLNKLTGKVDKTS